MTVDSDYITLAEACKRAGLKNADSLYKAVRSGRLKRVTILAGPRIVRLTTQAWLDDYLASRSTGQPAGRTHDHTDHAAKPDDDIPADPA